MRTRQPVESQGQPQSAGSQLIACPSLPSGQVQVQEPGRLTHVAPAPQMAPPSVHSSRSSQVRPSPA